MFVSLEMLVKDLMSSDSPSRGEAYLFGVVSLRRLARQLHSRVTLDVLLSGLTVRVMLLPLG